MKNNYLLLICAHVDSEEKKEFVIENLLKLKEKNIDVCFSTHSSMYLDEISKLVKFIIYDNNNEFVVRNDYIKNSDLLNNNQFEFGSSYIYKSESFGKILNFIPGSPHSKSALSLLKNGIGVSILNLYKWVVYLEYDIVSPISGFKDFIERRINILQESNKKCFYYLQDRPELNFIWTGFFICDTSIISNNKSLLSTDWFSSKRNWIKKWKIGFFESIVESILKESYSTDQIIYKPITDDFNEWSIDVENLTSHINKFTYHQTLNKNLYFKNNYEIDIYPSISNNEYKLNLYIGNNNEYIIDIKNIIINDGENTIFYIDNLSANPYSWNLYPIPFNEKSTLYFTYEIVKNDNTVLFSEVIDTNNIENIYNISRIEYLEN
jgi:hypothetical protein